MWCIPEADANYVACLEDILEQYEQPYDPQRPLVCYDEGLKQLIAETRLRIPAQPGRVARYDYEYRRHGVCNLHICFEPLAGRRQVKITARHTRQDFAHCMRWLVDEVYPEAEVIRIILDNLNSHTPGALYVTFPPAEARRILRRLEFHFTHKHASWLNMAEIEWSVFSRSLPVHIPDADRLTAHVQALTAERNQNHSSVDWQFRTPDARIKLKRLYQSIPE